MNFLPKRLLRVGTVIELTSFSRSTIYAMVTAGTFPKPIQISPNRVAWPAEAVESWIDARIAESA